MKKLVLMFALAALLVGGTACSKKAGASDGSSLAAKIENCTNTDSLTLYVQQAKDYAQKLVDEGKVEQAREYLAKIEPVVKEKSPALASALSAAGSLMDKVSDSVKKSTDSATDAVKDAADATGEAVNEAAGAAADKANEVKDATVDKAKEIKDAAADKAEEIKDATVDKAKEIKDAAADKADQAADAVKDKLNQLKGDK